VNRCISYPSQQAHSSSPEAPDSMIPNVHLSQEAHSSFSQAPDSMTPTVPCFALAPSMCYPAQQSYRSSSPQIPQPTPPLFV